MISLEANTITPLLNLKLPLVVSSYELGKELYIINPVSTTPWHKRQ